MSSVTILSDLPLTPLWLRTFERLVSEEFPAIDEIDLILGTDEDARDKVLSAAKVLSLGIPKAKGLLDGVDAYMAPSQAACLGTAGGLTKLTQALTVYLGGRLRTEDYPY